ncbi:MAG: metal-dependent hydrolase [Minwuiales bacterium]|nr:metal-dependent hydrolase [Minwuiales bacterium]
MTGRLIGLALGVVALGLLASGAARAADVQWFGQAAFKITSPGGKVILIDPFITKNPKTPEDLKDLSKLGQVDLILVTHGHGDHIGDTAEIAKMTGAKVGMNADMGQTFRTLGIVPGEQLIRFNKSGPIQPLGDGITVTMVRAEHSSAVLYKDPETGKIRVFPGGEPAGYIVELEDGKTFYHAGDTGVFGDMAFIGSFYDPDVALLPIGGHFTMGPKHAAYAVTELLKTKTVVPMHYGTFPPLKGTPEQFKAALGDYDGTVVVMQPGDTRKF